MSDSNFSMSAEQLLKIHADLKEIGVEIILDGGWGVDALLGEQTRDHKDVDFFINKKDTDKAKDYFLKQGFDYSQEVENTWWHFVLENDQTMIDVHVLEFEGNGDGFYGPRENNAIFPASALNGKGTVNGVEFRCLSAPYRVECLTVDFGVITKTGYTLRPTDYLDIGKLCSKYDIPMPEEYKAGYQKALAGAAA